MSGPLQSLPILIANSPDFLSQTPPHGQEKEMPPSGSQFLTAIAHRNANFEPIVMGGTPI
jgi:hypothetical protein